MQWDETDKHKVLWLIPDALLREALARSRSSSSSIADLGHELWQQGRLHVAPRGREYARQRMSVTPDVETPGSLAGALLEWCGAKLYQHQALLQAAFNLAKEHAAGAAGNVFKGILTVKAISEHETLCGFKFSSGQKEAAPSMTHRSLINANALPRRS